MSCKETVEQFGSWYLFSVLILHPGMYLYRFGESVLCEHGIAG